MNDKDRKVMDKICGMSDTERLQLLGKIMFRHPEVKDLVLEFEAVKL